MQCCKPSTQQKTIEKFGARSAVQLAVAWNFTCRRAASQRHALFGSRLRIYPLLLVLSLGLIRFFGVFRCRLCGHARLTGFDLFDGFAVPNPFRKVRSRLSGISDRNWTLKHRVANAFRSINPFTRTSRSSSGSSKSSAHYKWAERGKSKSILRFLNPLYWLAKIGRFVSRLFGAGPNYRF